MRRILIGSAVAIPLLVAVIAVVAWVAYDERVNDDKIGRNVSAAGIDMSGLSADEAEAAIASYEEQLATEPATFSVDGDEVTLEGSAIGLEVAEQEIAARALAVRRQGGFFSDFTGWVRSWWAPAELTVAITIDEEQLERLLDEWDKQVIDEPAYEGAVLIDNGIPVPEYPKAGQMIDRELAIPLILASLETPDRKLVVLPLTDLTPIVGAAEVDAAVARATEMVSRPVSLSLDGFAGQLVFPQSRVAAAITSEPVVQSPAEVVLSLDPEVLAEGLESRFDAFSTPAVDATFVFDEETKQFTVVASTPAVVVDIDALPEAVEAAALGSGRGVIPTKVGEDAALTTEMAQAMGPITEISTFTTFHPCCASRVVNIQLMADAVDGAIVMPGDTFSINERVGERTTAKGYRRAGAIIGGALYCCDSPVNIGGGTSQFGTTFYNAVFFSCLDDVEHQPHSLYFARYPFVREATLGFPKPDVIFLNDSDAIVYIDTSHTAGSITVTFYGNNGSLECTAERSGNTVTRLMRRANGSLVETEQWSWFYRTPKTTTTTTSSTIPEETTTTVGSSTTTIAETTTTAAETTTTSAETTTTAAGG